MGKNLGVDDKWAYNIIKQVGNYGESFETTLGQKSAMKLERGLNASYKNGGLMYGWPVRTRGLPGAGPDVPPCPPRAGGRRAARPAARRRPVSDFCRSDS